MVYLQKTGWMLCLQNIPWEKRGDHHIIPWEKRDNYHAFSREYCEK